MAHSSSLRLLALHALRLGGTAEADDVAAVMGTDVGATRAELAALAEQDLVSYRYGRMAGFQLTPEGRALGERLVQEELASTGTRPDIEQAYQRFLAHNDELLAVCTAWQLREVDGEMQANDHRDPAHDGAVLDRLSEVHRSIDPVLADLAGTLARFAGHRRRMATALERVLAGEHDYLTKPMFPSYHSSWFELHEDLLVTLGLDRPSGGNH